MAKSKKSMMRTSRLQPRITELQRRHEGNQQKLNEEMAKLYREEKINPMSGCLWSLIPFPILIALYSVIRQPLTKMMGLGAEAVTQLTDWVTTNAGYVAQAKSAYQEIQIADLIHQNWDAVTGRPRRLFRQAAGSGLFLHRPEHGPAAVVQDLDV